MPANRRRIAVTAPYDRWVLLGKLLEGRRQILGYTYRAPGFERERRVNRRLAADLERAAPKRVDHFTEGSLRLAAWGYQVAYSPKEGPNSMLAVLAGESDVLAPAAPDAPVPRIFPDEPPAWMAGDEARTEADRPYRDEIMGRLNLLRLQGKAPTGERLFGKGTPDARDWDKYAADWEDPEEVAWLVADLQRREVGRAPNSGTGTTGA
jgi:hypothetical protein